MLTLEEIQNALKDHRLEVVAAETGFSYYTIKRYAEGTVTDPPHKTIRILSDYLAPTEAA